MCEQTEINYLDGDVVWVKLGACWWPGQVTGLHNLPEDIQTEFQKKPLIAAVKFFQEDTYEFVKNYQQIYKYNCTLKDEFIRKGLDKYRSKSKDGASYMDKFPGDVEMAEKLTGGDPDILTQEKFSPEEKPDISALFGEKRIPKKKRDRDDGHRRSDGTEIIRKITHPRFVRESDHEVRIRQQPSSLPSTPTSTGSPVYRCHVCSFTSTRVNVIICHQKNHRSGSTLTPAKIKTYSQSHSRISDTSTPKRKYVKKEKSQSNKKKSESGLESNKRKHFKQNEKSNKKKKTDPELREKLLADWDDESDDEMSVDVNNSLERDLSSPSMKNQFNLDDSNEHREENTEITENEIMTETEKLLKETEELSSIQMLRESLDNLHASKKIRLSFERKSEAEKSEEDIKTDISNESFNKSQKKDTSNSDGEIKNVSDKDDKKSRLSCFDFEDDDLSEPSIPPVRKIPRVFGEKNLSLKKEIIKEFEMSQALKNEIRKESEISSKMTKSLELKTDEIMEIIQGNDNRQERKEIETNEKLDKTVRDKTEVRESEDKEEKQIVPSEDNQQKSNIKSLENEGEIVETLKVIKEDGDNDRSSNVRIDIEKKTKIIVPDVSVKNKNETLEEKAETLVRTKSSDDKLFQAEKIDSENPIAESNDNAFMKEVDDTLSERFTTETEDETVSESAETMPEQSENSDVDSLSRNREVLVKRGRGRPRKSVRDANVSKNLKTKIDRGNKKSRMAEKIEIERKTSDSDTDRSYSGRKRKPNKKYLESDIYVPDPDYRAFRTDESQSENETRTSEKIASKSRKNKRFKGENFENKSSELIAQVHELEISDQTSIINENNISTSLIDTKHEIDESKVYKQEISSEIVEEKFEEMKCDILTESMKSLNEKANITKVDMDVPLEEVKKMEMSETKNKTETNLDSVRSIEEPTEIKEKDNLIKQDKDIGQDQKKPHEKQTASTADKMEAQREIPKTNVDMLPPKKSQIKKFELSQIDFFDVHTNKTAEIESEPERKIEPNIQVSKIEPEKSERKLEFQTDFEEKIDKEHKVEVKTPSKVIDEVVKFPIDTEKNLKSFELEQKPDEIDVKEQEMQSIERVSPKNENQFQLKSLEKSPLKSGDTSKSPTKTIEQQSTPKKSSMQTRYKGKFTPETGKGKKDLFAEEKPVNTFQEAFLKTLQIDKKKIIVENVDVCKGKDEKKVSKKKTEADTSTAIQDMKIEEASKNFGDVSIDENIQFGGIPVEGNTSNLSVVSNFENVEIVVEEKVERNIKTGDSIFATAAQFGSSPSEFVITKSLESETSSEDNATIGLVTKLDETSKTSIPATFLTTEISVPVKKREMPRIIENVTLTEPVQILKTKLLDKLPQKSTKLDHTDVTKGGPKTKIMKIETLPSNSKMKVAMKSNPTSPQVSLTKKLQILKTEEANALASSNMEQSIPTTQTIVAAPVTEKFIQQSSQSLADMELDINSMPFVLSEDVLTPESIEQMPVVISSILPASSSIPATLSFTPTTQIVSPTQTQFKINETVVAAETSPTKKKSGVPAILKNKSKARPTITSVKTLVPPLTGGIKGLKFQNTQSVNKTPSLLTQKSASPGNKYVVVQTAGGQQLRYSVQGKSGTQQKIAISTGKTGGNAQVIQQGGKVVILTSGQSCQTKMVPLNISKTLSGKVQRIVTSKGQLLCPINPQSGIITSKIIAPKADTGVAAAAVAAAGSSTTSKLTTSGHKIINTQGIITSKGVLTPIPGTIAKTALLGTLSQGILTKGGIYTPISASALSGKIIGSKTLVTKTGTTLLSPQAQNLGGTKAILTPVSQAIAGKTILGTQAIVSSKGTILTPITGQQVKAIAAKSPVKGNKVQYQQVQQKVQLPILQKSSKVPISVASSQGRMSVKSQGGTLILQNAAAAGNVMTQKGTHGKKIIKQTVVQSGVPIQNIASPSGTQQTMTMVQQIQPKSKTAAVQKVIIPRTGNRQTKTQQKILVQKVQEPVVSTVQGIHTKQTIVATTSNVPVVAKTVIQSKQIVTPVTPKSSVKSHSSTKTSQIQKTLLNVAMNSISTATTNANIATTVALPPLEPIDTEKKIKMDVSVTDTVQKEQNKIEKFQVAEKNNDAEKTAEEPKMATQPQIMALPTESSDGTQTYVLVTIDEQGQIQPLDNNALMSLEGTTQNPDGTRTLYIDPSSLGEAGTLDNIVLQFDNGILPGIQTNVTEPNQTTIITENFPASEVIQTSNQDILAAALANTDFQQEINLPENQTGSVMTQTGLTQTSLINQTILQSTIIPPTEPISSPSVLETSLTLNQPIMTPLEVPSNLPIQSTQDSTSTSVVSTIPSSLEPITITNPNIYISTAGETQIQIPSNSMPDIGEIIENPATATATVTAAIPASGEIDRAEIPVSTQYLVIPNLDNIAVADAQNVPNVEASYTVTVPNSIVLENSQQMQTTPSMPIIDDTYTDNSQFATTIVATFTDVPVSEMLVSKAPAVSVENVQSQDVTSEMIVSRQIPVASPQKPQVISIDESKIVDEKQCVATAQEVYSSQKVSVTSEELISSQSVKEASSAIEVTRKTEDEKNVASTITGLPMIDDTTDDTQMIISESNSRVDSMETNFEVTDTSELKTIESHEVDTVDKLKQLSFAEGSKVNLADQQIAGTSKQLDVQATQLVESLNSSHDGETPESELYAGSTTSKQDARHEDYQEDEPSSQEESDRRRLRQSMELRFEEEEEATNAETSPETPSQSRYGQFIVSISTDVMNLPSQSAKSESSSGEATQSVTYEPMEIDEEAVVTEPPTQSFEDSKINEASQSYEASADANVNAPTQSFNEIIQREADESSADEAIDQSFPTQSYEVDKGESMTEDLESDAEISQEGNIPSQSNDIGADGIGTSSVSTNNSGLNEDETASSSYVPETPENQERDQDQESAISTSSYEIPPCEELNIASSSVIPDTSVSAEHSDVHDNGVPEIPTSSSYNLNPDITSTHHVDSATSSSYEDQVIVEQNVSTSYEVPISMPGLEETCSQNFVTESSDDRNEPSSYYASHHQEVTASYYESVDQDSANSRLEEDPNEEHVTPGDYYEGNPQEVSQSYFAPAEETPNYTSHSISPSYYDPSRPESEASQSYYSTEDLDGKTEEQSSSSPNIEASQSFYQERSGELRLRQQGEATPTYTERYPVDYTLENSPIERHDLVESSVPATRSMDR